MPLGPSFPELASLDLFVSVVELGSVSRAAAAHGVAQPSASSRIRHLERQLGMILLERSPSGSIPTDAGVVVAGWAEAILRSAHELACKPSRPNSLGVFASLPASPSPNTYCHSGSGDSLVPIQVIR